MIHFFTKHPNALGQFLDSWAPELKPHIRWQSYSRATLHSQPEPGAYIFSDFERLRPGKFAQAKNYSGRLRGLAGTSAVLNDPSRYVSRFDLLRMLHERGVNQFRVFRANDLDAVKFPVFLRNEMDHSGPISGLLHSREEIGRAMWKLSPRNWFRRKRLMLVEYCDCADDQGVFRKYSAMNVGGRLIPRHVLFSRDWVTKKPDLVSDATVGEELQFITQFPEKEQLAEVFELAGIDYGRVDYGMKDGRVQVWEINTNPVVVPRREKLDPKRLASQTQSARLITESLLALAGSS